MVKKIIGGLLSLLLLALSIYIFLPVLSFRFLHLPILLLIVGGIIYSVLLANSLEIKGKGEEAELKWTSFKKSHGIVGGILGAVALYIIVALVGSTSLFTWETRHQALDIVSVEDFNTSVPNVDMQNLIILDESSAMRTSERLLTETDPTMGSQFRIGEGTLTVVNDAPYWVFPLEYRGFFKWLGTKGEIPGYIRVSATHFNQAEFVPYTYGVCPTGYLGDDLKRLIYSKYPQYGLTDFSFEIDENNDAFWVVTAYTRKGWLSTPHVLGTIIVDPVSRDITFYELGEQPHWVNRVFPTSFFKNHLKWYGQYTEGWWNPSDRGKLRSTDGLGYVFKDNEIFYYTGLTSYGEDSATTGFVIYNPRTGEAHYNRLSGIIESRATDLMEELVQNAGYTANFPYLINLNGEPTYFSTLKGNRGNIVGYAFASVQNYTAVAWAPQLRDAQTEYSRQLVRQGTGHSLHDQSNIFIEVKGSLSRVGMLRDSFYVVKLVNDDRFFIVDSNQFPSIALSEKGDHILIRYIETTEINKIDAIEFLNESLK